jgi:hypothetical protein
VQREGKMTREGKRGKEGRKERGLAEVTTTDGRETRNEKQETRNEGKKQGGKERRAC